MAIGFSSAKEKLFLRELEEGMWLDESDIRQWAEKIKQFRHPPIKTIVQNFSQNHKDHDFKKVERRRLAYETVFKLLPVSSYAHLLAGVLPDVDINGRQTIERVCKGKLDHRAIRSFAEKLRHTHQVVRQSACNILKSNSGHEIIHIVEQLVRKERTWSNTDELIRLLVDAGGDRGADVLKTVIRKYGMGLNDKLALIQSVQASDSPKCLESLAALHDDPELVVRIGLAKAIASKGSRRHIGILYEILRRKGENDKVVVKALEGLQRIQDSKTLNIVLPYLENRNTAVRIAAINVLGKSKEKRAVLLLTELLNTPDLNVRNRVIAALGELGQRFPDEITRLLLPRMGDPDKYVRRAIVEIFRTLGDVESLWIEMIHYLEDADFWIRERIAQILGDLNLPNITPHILPLLDSEDASLRRYAVEILQGLKDPDTLPRLRKMAYDSNWLVRERVIETLGILKDKNAVSLLIRLLSEPEMRTVAVHALGEIGVARSVQPILDYLPNETSDGKIEFLNALVKFKDRRIAEGIRPLLDDNDKLVRKKAAEVLREIGYSDLGDINKVEQAFLVGHKVSILDKILIEARRKKGSDIFISSGSFPCMKRHGKIIPIYKHKLTYPEVKNMLMQILTPDQRKVFQQKMEVDFSYEIRGECRFRGSIFRHRKGMNGVFRVIETDVRSWESLGLPEILKEFCKLPRGLVLVTGAGGSGKTTTLAAMIDYINQFRTDHVLTIEDPIEYTFENNMAVINQRELYTHTSSYTRALRSALREDPDIVLVGELRDLETTQLAITVAETGHLVFGTLHTINAPKTIDRIIDAFPARQQPQIRQMLSESIRAVISQKLLNRKDGTGRVAAFEIMIADPSISNLIREGKVFQIPSIMSMSAEKGMQMMDSSIMKLLKADIITPEEAYFNAYNKADFEFFVDPKLQRKGYFSSRPGTIQNDKTRIISLNEESKNQPRNHSGNMGKA